MNQIRPGDLGGLVAVLCSCKGGCTFIVASKEANLTPNSSWAHQILCQLCDAESTPCSRTGSPMDGGPDELVWGKHVFATKQGTECLIASGLV